MYSRTPSIANPIAVVPTLATTPTSCGVVRPGFDVGDADDAARVEDGEEVIVNSCVTVAWLLALDGDIVGKGVGMNGDPDAVVIAVATE